MKQMLSSDFFRFTRTKMTWILIIITGGVTLFTSLTYGLFLGNAAWLQAYMEKVAGLYEEYGLENPFSLMTEAYGLQAESVYEFVTLSLSSELVIIGAVFTLLYSVRFRKTGYIVNVYPLQKPSAFYFSNALMLLLFTVLTVFTAVLSTVPAILLFFDGDVLGNTGDFLLYLLLFTLLIFVVLLQIVTYTRIARGPSMGTFTVLFYILFGYSVIYKLIDSLIHAVFKTDFYIEYILPLGNIGLLSLGKKDTYLSAAIVILLFAGISMASELVNSKNKDVI